MKTLNSAKPNRGNNLQARRRAALFAVFAYTLACAANAQFWKPNPKDDLAPPKVTQTVGFDQKLNVQVPLDLPFTDDTGKQVKLGDYFNHGRPVILVMVYYGCPMLCTQVLNDLTKTLRSLDFEVGKQFDIVTVSINPEETPALAAEKKKSYLHDYNRPSADGVNGWHFLVGKQESIQALANAIGFRYMHDKRSGLYFHASGIVALTPQGKTARYFLGLDYWPKELRLALLDASNGKIGSLTDQVILYCYRYDPATGKYSLSVIRLVQAGCAVTFFILAGFMLINFRREKYHPLAPQTPPPSEPKEGADEA